MIVKKRKFCRKEIIKQHAKTIYRGDRRIKHTLGIFWQIRRNPKNNQGEIILFFGLRLGQFRVEHLFIFPKLPKLTFSQLYAYYWTKTSEGRRHRSWRLYEEKWDEKWQRQVLGYSKVKSLRLPCMVNVRDEPSLFFQHHGVLKRGRKVKGWLVHFDRKDTIYQRFVSRFFEDGNLSFGGQRFWSTDNSLVQVIGVKWSPPKIRSASVSRKSQLASQPRDDTDYVYLIRMGHSLIFKIGKSNDPQGRLANLQTANPYKLKMVHLFRADNASAAEEMLHGYFHEKRKEGEWFRLTQVEKELLLKVSQFEQGCFVVEGVRLSIKDLFGDHRNNT